MPTGLRIEHHPHSIELKRSDYPPINVISSPLAAAGVYLSIYLQKLQPGPFSCLNMLSCSCPNQSEEEK